jgi:hypothetical protein
VDAVGDAVAADGAPSDADADADGVNDGLRPLLAADVPFSADIPFSAEAAESAGVAGAAEVGEAAESASAAIAACWLLSQLLSPELIVCRLPCRSPPRPLLPAGPDESADRPFALPIVSAGSGTSVLDPAFVVSSSATSVESAEVAASPEVSVSAESPEVPVSPEEEESPLAPPDRRDAPERELPVLARDDDMMPLSTIVSVASPSGSAFRLGGAMMSGG